MAKIMAKHIAHIGLMMIAGLLAACESNDSPIQHADNYGYITFSVQAEQVGTRTNPYEAYDPTRHPLTMGVFGYHDIASYAALSAASNDAQLAKTTRASYTPDPNPIFNNEVINYSTSEKAWSSTSRKRWDDYRGAKNFDFFAYMPQNSRSELSRTSTDTYTLSIPFSMPSDKHILFESKQQAIPIICAKPEHKEGTTASGDEFTFERVVKMQFDQTLTAYRLLFRLDSKMNALRQFRIHSVKLSGNIATSGTVSRTYQWANSDWTAGNITWSNLTRQTFDETNFVNIPYANTASGSAKLYDDEAQTLLVTSAGYTQWGESFYCIPDAEFLPTITVNYDVEFVDEDGETIITRKDVTSSIALNRTNFSGLTAGGIAMVNPVRILIQPRYLYVMADEDAYTGHLLVE